MTESDIWLLQLGARDGENSTWELKSTEVSLKGGHPVHITQQLAPRYRIVEVLQTKSNLAY